MISAGHHKAMALPADPSEAFGQSTNGKDYVMVRFQITEGDHAGEQITWWGYFSTEKGAARTIDSLRYAGCTFPTGELQDLTGLGTQEVSLEVAHEEYDGKTRAKVLWVNSSGGAYSIPEEQKMGPAALKDLSKRMKSLLLGSAPKTTVPGGAPKAAGAGVGADDIPF